MPVASDVSDRLKKEREELLPLPYFLCFWIIIPEFVDVIIVKVSTFDAELL
jgi:hypothetical protein